MIVRSRRLSASIGSFGDNGSTNFRYIQEVEDNPKTGRYGQVATASRRAKSGHSPATGWMIFWKQPDRLPPAGHAEKTLISVDFYHPKCVDGYKLFM